MKKSTCILGFMACFVFSNGVLFEIMHWPFSGIIMFSGFISLNLGFMPVFFYEKFKACQ